MSAERMKPARPMTGRPFHTGGMRAWTMTEWRDALKTVGFAVAHEEIIPKKMMFETWASRHDVTMRAFIRALIANGDAAVAAELKPQEEGADLSFELKEGLFVAHRV